MPPTPALPCSVPSSVLCFEYHTMPEQMNTTCLPRVAPSLLSLLHPAPAVCAINCSHMSPIYICVSLKAKRERATSKMLFSVSLLPAFVHSSFRPQKGSQVQLSAPGSFAPPLLVAEHTPKVPTPPATPGCMQTTVGRGTPYLLTFCAKSS